MKCYINVLLFLILCLICDQIHAQSSSFVSENGQEQSFELFSKSVKPAILLDTADFIAVKMAADNLQQDFLRVTDFKPQMIHQTNANGSQSYVIIGTLGRSRFIDKLVKSHQLDAKQLEGKNEKYLITTVKNPLPNVDEALVIAGSDRRGTVYGIYELSKQMGVSPWYYWADVPVKKHQNLFVKRGTYTEGEPAVKYRGIFLNDEEPALGGWARATFGGFNHEFYAKVFELILRLKGNFMWPAMWGSAFYDDDPENGKLANDMGIVMGTSHHEPMNCAQQDWKRRGTGPWNYNTNAAELDKLWKFGMERSKNYETVVTVGMRGDGDEAMTEGTNIALLEKIVKNQRKIIKEVTGKKPSETPQVWALYKEVQEYYDKGMRVPDDVTLLLCDDNWGNVRKLPAMDAKPRKGGYGMYYHFDFVGGPRNYKWINISKIQRIWEQMNLTYTHGVDKIWIVNVGDLKPMEFPITFFMDMAWNPKRFNADNLMQYTEDFCAEQFGEQYAKESARIINLYTKYNSRVTPELLNDRTYSLENYDEFEQVTNDYQALALDANRLYRQIPDEAKNAFYELVLYPVDAMANLYEMYYAQAKNKQLAIVNNPEANIWADKVKECYDYDSLLTYQYHHLAGGKWNHMMSQIHIGYFYWQEPRTRRMPKVEKVENQNDSAVLFVENDGYISMEAVDFSSKYEPGDFKWEMVKDLGKTAGAVISLPIEKGRVPLTENSPKLSYDVYSQNAGKVKVYMYFSPTINYTDYQSLEYGLSLDNEKPVVVDYNDEPNINTYNGIVPKSWEKNVAESIKIVTTEFDISKSGRHTLNYYRVDEGLVLQKIVIDCDGLKASYLGAPESKRK